MHNIITIDKGGTLIIAFQKPIALSILITFVIILHIIFIIHFLNLAPLRIEPFGLILLHFIKGFKFLKDTEI
jgi:hypothetical protein